MNANSRKIAPTFQREAYGGKSLCLTVSRTRSWNMNSSSIGRQLKKLIIMINYEM
jgi:hypothetical protein